MRISCAMVSFPMKRISIEDAKDGMKLAKAVENASGMTLYGEGMQLTASAIAKLRSLGIRSIYIEGKANPRLNKEDYLEFVDNAFSRIIDNSLMEEIKRKLIEHIELLYE